MSPAPVRVGVAPGGYNLRPQAAAASNSRLRVGQGEGVGTPGVASSERVVEPFVVPW